MTRAVGSRYVSALCSVGRRVSHAKSLGSRCPQRSRSRAPASRSAAWGCGGARPLGRSARRDGDRRRRGPARRRLRRRRLAARTAAQRAEHHRAHQGEPERHARQVRRVRAASADVRLRASGAQRQAHRARGGRAQARAGRQLRRAARASRAAQAGVPARPPAQPAAHRRPGQGRRHAQGRALQGAQAAQSHAGHVRGRALAHRDGRLLGRRHHAHRRRRGELSYTLLCFTRL